MGKNVHGGAGHKKFARKHNLDQQPERTNRLRVVTNVGELYAIVTKMLGNNMFHCYCSDNVTRMGFIRGKFTGRRKRENLVVCGKWVMVGLNDWNAAAAPANTTNTTTSASKPKLQKCELLEVYTDSEKSQLRETVKNVNWASFDLHDVVNVDVSTNRVFDDGIVFETEQDAQRRLLEKQCMDASVEKITMGMEMRTGMGGGTSSTSCCAATAAATAAAATAIATVESDMHMYDFLNLDDI